MQLTNDLTQPMSWMISSTAKAVIATQFNAFFTSEATLIINDEYAHNDDFSTKTVINRLRHHRPK